MERQVASSQSEIEQSVDLDHVRVATDSGLDRTGSWPSLEGSPSNGSGPNGSPCSNDDSQHKRTYHVDEALTSIGFGRYQWFMLFYTGIAWAGDAMEMMLLSFLGPFVKCEWGLTATQESLLTTCVFLGMLFGVNFFGYLSDICGRRVGFFTTALFSAVMGFGSAIAPSYQALIFFRAMVGIGLGGVPVAFTLFMEFIPSANRGRWLVIIESFWTIGTFFEAGIAWAVLPTLGWRWLLAISAVPQVLLILLYPFLPESPYWLASKGRREQATKVLGRVARVNGTQLPKGLLQVSTVSKDEAEEDSSSGAVAAKAGSCWCGLLRSLGSLFAVVGALYTMDMRKTTLLLHYIWIAAAIGYYGLVILTTELHVEGSKACSEEGTPNFDREDYMSIFITTLAEVPGLILAELTVDHLGRRKSMGFSLMIGGVSTLFLTLGLSINAETVFLFVSRCFVLCAFTVLYIFTPEAYPTSSRSMGLGLNNAFSRIGGMVAPFIAVDLPEAGKEVSAELILAGLAFFGGLAALFLPFETAGRELKEDPESDHKPERLLEMAEIPVNHDEMFQIATPDSEKAISRSSPLFDVPANGSWYPPEEEDK